MKIFLDTVGCRLNQSEIEGYARQFRAAGHTLVPSPDQADLVVINTCAVTSEAASDSRQRIRQAARAGVAQVVATGCWVTLHSAAAAALPSVTRVIPNSQKDWLVPDLLDISFESIDLEPLARLPIPGHRARTRAFIKVQDGCDNRCTFCVTTLARGPGRSRLISDILADVQAALNTGGSGETDISNGAKEIVLTGVHLGSWGHDLSPRLQLRDLIQAILDKTDPPRLRLSSLEPWDLDSDFFSLWKDPRLCQHLHLPLQSGSRETLRRMARKTTPDSFFALLEAARSAIPEVAITTDIITGFPGEDEREFAESLAFVRSMQFAGGHVFTYSSRPGTAAARMPDQVPMLLRKQRNAQIRAEFSKAASVYQERFVGKRMQVLWESAQEGQLGSWDVSGLTSNYIRVTARATQPLRNQISQVRLLSLERRGMSGVIESSRANP